MNVAAGQSTNGVDLNNNITTKQSAAVIKKLAAATSNEEMSRQLLAKLKLDGAQQQSTNRNGGRREWNIDSSQFSKLTSNPVRKLIEQMRLEPNPDLPMIALSIGDPTIFSDIGKPDTVIEAVEKCIRDKRYDGYTPSFGSETARAAVAKYCSRPDDLVYKPADIILTNGCSQAIDLCITVLANRGQNIIIPKPGFSIYKTLCGTLGIDVKYYNLIVSFRDLKIILY
jgi:DNA-binding transcriptional MocR family regulator